MEFKMIRTASSPAFLGLLLVLALTAGFLPLAFCADNSGQITDKLVKSDSPIRIASDRMEVHQNGRTISFQGHVLVQQDDLTITGNQLKVNAAAGAKPGQASMMEKIDRIEVEGDVKITQRDKIATAEKAVYYHQEQKIVLLGNPSVSQGADTVKGRLITLYIKEGKSVVEGGEQSPVQAVLHPSRKD
jgi:lipopolysaccharide export system protein LptA